MSYMLESRRSKAWIVPLCILLSILVLNVEKADCTDKKNGFAEIIDFYQTYISPIDGDRCTMHPSCSQYFREACQKHGIFKGWIMGCDRLLRCGGDEDNLSRSIWLNRKKHCYDPVENNDFWWLENE